MSFTKDKRSRIKNYILEKIDAADVGIIEKTASVFNISDKTVYRYLQELVAEGILLKTKRQYRLTYEEFTYSIKRSSAEELGEDLVYSQNVLKHIEKLNPNVRSIWDYGFTEMMNNAIDHSEAENILIIVRKNYLRTSIGIIDDGVGIFKKIMNTFKLSSVDEAVNELFKGKLTTDTKHHSGEGIFFTSRLMDFYAAFSDDTVFTHNKYSEISDKLDSIPLNEINPKSHGTCIYMSLSNFSNRNAIDIFNSYASVEGGFTKTSIPLKNIYDMPPVARSQAKRLVKRLENFEEVILDFDEIDSIGQGFAHELFVVFQNEHKKTRLVPINANNTVNLMISHVLNANTKNNL